ncbi:nuclear transport factor 2 family protein [Saccharopolyspora tripterygii]
MASIDAVAESYAGHTIRSVCSAVADYDVERVLGYFDDSCVLVDGTTGEAAGSDRLAGFLDEMFPDESVGAAHVDGDAIGVVYEITGTLNSPDGSSIGKQLRWVATAFSTFAPSLLAITREVYRAEAAPRWSRNCLQTTPSM